jgi:hypothetical protein
MRLIKRSNEKQKEFENIALPEGAERRLRK